MSFRHRVCKSSMTHRSHMITVMILGLAGFTQGLAAFLPNGTFLQVCYTDHLPLHACCVWLPDSVCVNHLSASRSCPCHGELDVATEWPSHGC
jgi:hypothetical protein